MKKGILLGMVVAPLLLSTQTKVESPISNSPDMIEIAEGDTEYILKE